MTPARCDVLIVGAGMSGLTAAHELRRHGLTTVNLDKGRGVGGRMATRRSSEESDARWDHGAQFITVRDTRFEASMKEWISSGSATLWCHGFGDGSRTADSKPSSGDRQDGHPRYRGVSGMSAIPKTLGADLDVETSARVVRLTTVGTANAGERVVRVETEPVGDDSASAESHRQWTARAILFSAPVTQSLELIDHSEGRLEPELRASLDAVEYEPCIAFLWRLDAPSAMAEPGGARPTDAGPIAWIADNQRKGISKEPTVTVHLDGVTSREVFDDPRRIEAQVERAARPFLGSAAIVERQCHRWRFSAPSVPFGATHAAGVMRIGDSSLPVAFCGDAFTPAELRGRVEGAAVSGLEAAGELATRLS